MTMQTKHYYTDEMNAQIGIPCGVIAVGDVMSLEWAWAR